MGGPYARSAATSHCSSFGTSDACLAEAALLIEGQQLVAPLTLDELRALGKDVDAREGALGERLYSLIGLLQATRRPGKVTGMLLDGLDAEDFMEILMNASPHDGACALLSWVGEASSVLGEEAEARRAATATATATATVSEGEGLAASISSSAADGSPCVVGAAATPHEANEWQVVPSKGSKRRQRAPPAPQARAHSTSSASSSDGSWS